MISESATQCWKEIGRTTAAGTKVVGCNNPGEDLSEEIRSSHGYMKGMIGEPATHWSWRELGRTMAAGAVGCT